MVEILLASILTCTEAETKIQYVSENASLPAVVREEVIRAITESAPPGCYVSINELDD